MSQAPLLETLRELAPAIAARESADGERYPQENVAALMQAGVPAAPLPVALGGRGTPLRECVQAIELLATASPSLALLISMPLGLAGLYGLGPAIAPEDYRQAWSNQIEEVTAEYRHGRIIAAGNSEKGAGGSLASTKTVAQRDEAGVFRLSGEKILGSFGPHADYFFSSARVSPSELPGAGVVEFFLVPARQQGVELLNDWDGFGMRPTESGTIRYTRAAARTLIGFPNFIETVQPVSIWYCLFGAISLGCAVSILNSLATPQPSSPALRLRLNEALMRCEAMRAYLLETAERWRPAGDRQLAARVLRAKTYVTQEATKLAAELFALGGGRHYRRSDRLARALADSFAGTALRPPLPLALDTLSESLVLDVDV